MGSWSPAASGLERSRVASAALTALLSCSREMGLTIAGHLQVGDDDWNVVAACQHVERFGGRPRFKREIAVRQQKAPVQLAHRGFIVHHQNG